MDSHFRRTCLALLLSLGLLAGSWTPLQPIPGARAADANVTTCDETNFDAALNTVQTTGGGSITFGCSGTITFTAQKAISEEVTIDGAGQAVVFDGNDATRLFEIADGARLALNNLTLQHARVNPDFGGAIINNGGGLEVTAVTFSGNDAIRGGAIYNDGGTVEVNTSSFSGNEASLGGAIYNIGMLSVARSSFSANIVFIGGGIYNQTGTLTVTQSSFTDNNAFNAGGIQNVGTAQITASTFSGNHVDRNGGAIYNNGTLTLTNSTLSGNSAESAGGALYNDGAGTGLATVQNSTLSGNSANFNGGAIWSNNGTVNLAATILANSTTPPSGGNCAGTAFVSQGENLSDDDSCNLNETGDLEDTDPLLGPLADNGGLTPTLLPQSSSPAIDASSSCPTSVDQRGLTRPLGNQCDIGSVEVAPFDIVAFCTEAAFDAALTAVQDNGGGTITFTCSGTIPITSQKTISQDVTINGVGQDVTLDGGDSTRHFNVAPGARLTLNSLTLENGGGISNGGAIYNEGSLAITDSSLRDNSASAGGAIYNVGTLSVTGSLLSGNNATDGGAIFNNANGTTLSDSVLSDNSATRRGGSIFNNDGTLGISDSTLSGNTASEDGGGIYNFASVTITNSTLSGNRATDDGGAIFNNIGLTITNSTLSGNATTRGSGGGVYNTVGTTRVTNSTLNLNTAGTSGGGIHYESGSFNLTASIVANSGTNCAGMPITSLGENLSDDASCNLTASSDLPRTNPLLGALADNGGPTMTHLPGDGSPARDAALSCPTSADQRSVARPQHTACDIGSVEVRAVIVDTPSVDSEPSEEGQAVTASATFTNPDGAGPVTCSVDYGDGDGPQTGTVEADVCAGPGHSYTEGSATGTDYTVTVTVTDVNTGSGSNSTSHTVINVAPSIDGISDDGPVDEGSPVTITVTATDPGGVNDPLTYSFDCDNDTTYETAGTNNTGQCTFNDNGTFTVGVQVSDDDSGTATDTTTVTVNNVAPVIDNVTTNGPAPQGQPVTITVDASDVGVNDTLTYRFDCDNDGSYETAGVGNQGQCTLDPGAASSTIGVQVMDDDLGIATGTVDVGQTLTLCANRTTGAVSEADRQGNCESGTVALTVPGPVNVTVCINRSTTELRVVFQGSCASTERVHLILDDGPLFYCESRWTGELRFSPTGSCGPYEDSGVIPG